MCIRYSKIFTIACFILLIAACSNEPSIKSATSEKVIIGGPPERFTAAYELAKNECQKNTKIAQYIPDNTTGLSEVAFNCVGAEGEEEAATTEETTTENEADTEEMPTEVEENPAETEDALTETEAGSTQEVQ
jgi:hypothetical protein